MILQDVFSKAIRENKALGLSFIYTKGNKVVRENANGEIEDIKKRPLQSSLKIKKGTILYVKSKQSSSFFGSKWFWKNVFIFQDK